VLFAAAKTNTFSKILLIGLLRCLLLARNRPRFMDPRRPFRKLNNTPKRIIPPQRCNTSNPTSNINLQRYIPSLMTRPLLHLCKRMEQQIPHQCKPITSRLLLPWNRTALQLTLLWLTVARETVTRHLNHTPRHIHLNIRQPIQEVATGFKALQFTKTRPRCL
jgi:hypothetical protein